MAENTRGLTPILQHALRYAGWGWYVFPLSLSKKPFKDSHGFKDARSDPTEVIALFDKWAPHGRCNIGLATGDVVVLDADGPGGLVKLKELTDAHGILPPTLTARTPRGGWHFFYTAPGQALPGYTQKRPSGADGLDVKAAKGYVLLDPSRGRSGAYVWDNALQVAPLPPWFADWLRTRGGTRPIDALGVGPMPAGVVPRDSGRLADRALAILTEPWSPHEENRLWAALDAIPRDASGYDTFFKVGMALQRLDWVDDSGTCVGFELWDSWCADAPHYDRAGLEKKWLSFGKGSYNGRPVTIGSVYEWARDAGWDGSVAHDPAPIAEPEKSQEINGHAAIPEVLAQAALVPASIRFPDVEKTGKIKQTCRNARVALAGLGLCCEHDTFHGRMLVGGQAIGQWAGELSDDAIQMLRVVIARQYGFDPGLVNTHDAAVQECLQQQFDPVIEYLDDLVWDGVARLGGWLTVYMGADATELNRAIGGLALVAAVRRARVPGTKFDQIIVLESPEGRGKSSAIEILAGAENFSDQLILTLDDKGQQEAVQGVWLYEIGDLAGMSRADVERVKAFASRKIDRARPAYGRARVDRARRCVFFASTNDDTYLMSQTGNRRFWPVRVGRIDLEALARDRDQLWAEAVVYEKRGISLVLPEEMWGQAGVEQDARRVTDAWDDLLHNAKGKKELVPTDKGLVCEERISTLDLLRDYLHVVADRTTILTTKRLAYTMRRLGWTGPKVLWLDNRSQRGYARVVQSTPDT